MGIRSAGVACVALGIVGGCGELFRAVPATFFTTPLVINGDPVGPAIIDTGGAYELMLREQFGLVTTDTVEVLAFGGREEVVIIEGFDYEVGGIGVTAEVALVGVSACDCNGVGFFFFRKTGIILGLDYSRLRVTFLTEPPTGGVAMPFAAPPPWMKDFDSAFVRVEVTADGVSHSLLGLLDTGTNGTVLKRGLAGSANLLSPNRLRVTIAHEALGVVAARVTLFDTPGLPDLIIGTDVMRAWADQWYFHFAPQGGTVIAFPHNRDAPAAFSEVGDMAQLGSR